MRQVGCRPSGVAEGWGGVDPPSPAGAWICPSTGRGSASRRPLPPPPRPPPPPPPLPKPAWLGVHGGAAPPLPQPPVVHGDAPPPSHDEDARRLRRRGSNRRRGIRWRAPADGAGTAPPTARQTSTGAPGPLPTASLRTDAQSCRADGRHRRPAGQAPVAVRHAAAAALTTSACRAAAVAKPRRRLSLQAAGWPTGDAPFLPSPPALVGLAAASRAA